MFERYAVFYTPTGPLAEFGAQWLGWDNAKGWAVPHPAIKGIDVDAVTRGPRKYGVHGTLKAPFHLAQGADQVQLHAAAKLFAATHGGVDAGPLALGWNNGFVALRPRDPAAGLRALAADVVTAFDPFRAPLTDADIARRRKAPLTARQDQQMLDWGYPFIFEDFHFHLTLTGQVSQDRATQVMDALAPRVDRILPDPLVIDAITLMGQDTAGLFHQIHRYALTG